MSLNFETVVLGGHVYSSGKFHRTDIGISNGKIKSLGNLSKNSAQEVVSATGLHIIPGAIDSHVHFREPGGTHKEDFESGTKSALLGGITAIFDMPNTTPETTDEKNLFDKIKNAKDRSWCDYAFYIGASHNNIKNLSHLSKLKGVCGIKVFMGCSTGDLLIEDDESISQILQQVKRVSIHAEDNNRLKERKHIAEESKDPTSHPLWRDAKTALIASQRIIYLISKTNGSAHILHSTTSDEMDLFLKGKINLKGHLTIEATPQHLTLLAPDCYKELGTLAQMNPPIRSIEHQQALWEAIHNNVIDTLGSDHAPHTLEEKSQTYPNSPSGMPGVQTLLPIMLNHVNQGRLSLEKLVELVSLNPSKIFGIQNRGDILPEMEATLTFIDMNQKNEISNSWIQSKCKWTPYNGMKVKGWPKGVFLRGKKVMWEDQLLLNPEGKLLEFN